MDEDDELRMLRARAYGPAADLHLDPVALRRLGELEAARRPGSAASAGPAPAPPTPAPAEPPTPGADAVEAAEEAPHPPVRRPGGRVMLAVVAAAAGVLVGAGIGAAVQAGIGAAPDAADGGELVATIASDPDFSWPSFFPEPGSLRAIGFSDMAGITVVAIPPSSAAARGWCIFTYETALLDTDSNSYAGDSERACEARPFPASIVIDLDRGPRSLRDEFPDASALRLVLDADRREVLVYAGRDAP